MTRVNLHRLMSERCTITHDVLSNDGKFYGNTRSHNHVASNVYRCSAPYPVDSRTREQLGLSAHEAVSAVFVSALPNTLNGGEVEIHIGDRLYMGIQNFRIVTIEEWPIIHQNITDPEPGTDNYPSYFRLVLADRTRSNESGY